MLSSLLFVLLLVLSTGYQATAQSEEGGSGCNYMGCLWEENLCDFQPGNPNDCSVGCYYIQGLHCQATSGTDCDVRQC